MVNPRRKLLRRSTPHEEKNDGILQMAEHWYGHGEWNARFWFIGPEPGMAQSEGHRLARRCQAWREAGGRDLIDCRTYHQKLNILDWHGSTARLQPTWRKLIRLLMSFQGQELSRETILSYQRCGWGRDGEETCVVELSSLAANNVRVVRDRATFLGQRVELLREKILQCKPTFVVMYGKAHLRYWEQIARGAFDDEGIREVGPTVALTTMHPVARGVCNQDWELCLPKSPYALKSLHLGESPVTLLPDEILGAIIARDSCVILVIRHRQVTDFS